MAVSCYHPMTMYRSIHVNERTGKRPLVFNRKYGFEDMPVTVPCGKCIGCRLEYSRQWAIRAYHESMMWQDNCFITLTFNDEELYKRERPWSLDLKEMQKFIKRLRKKKGRGVRIMYCGEYGEKHGRPHYHACLFNCDFNDKKLWTVRDGYRLYTSETLNKLWTFGFSTIGSMTWETAAYTARYITKKITGDKAESHYEYFDQQTGEIYQRKPEFMNSSRDPAIGIGWLEKYKESVYPHDYVVINGKKVKPPKAYDVAAFGRMLDKVEQITVKAGRRKKVKRHEKDNTKDRLVVKEEVTLRKLDLLKRGMEKDT
jgi:hypothetical protein